MIYNIKITRRCHVAGQPVDVGAIVQVPAATAIGLLGCGHSLADPDDEEALKDELLAEFAAQAVAAPVFGQSGEQAEQQVVEATAAFRPKPRMGFL